MLDMSGCKVLLNELALFCPFSRVEWVDMSSQLVLIFPARLELNLVVSGTMGQELVELLSIKDVLIVLVCFGYVDRRRYLRCGI